MLASYFYSRYYSFSKSVLEVVVVVVVVVGGGGGGGETFVFP